MAETNKDKRNKDEEIVREFVRRRLNEKPDISIARLLGEIHGKIGTNERTLKKTVSIVNQEKMSNENSEVRQG